MATASDWSINAGHGLHYENVSTHCTAIPQIVELNIGHAIVARSRCSMASTAAVSEMKRLMAEARAS